MNHVFAMLPAFLNEIKRYRASVTTDGIVIRSGHVARGFNLNHHDRQQLVDAVSSLSEAIQQWAKLEPTPESQKPVSPVDDGSYPFIHHPPADILMGTLAEKPAPKPDIIHHGVAIEVKAKRKYVKRSKDV